MSFTINRYTENRVIIKSNWFPKTHEIVLAVDKSIKEMHTCLLLANNHELSLPSSIFLLKDFNQDMMPYTWRKIYGVIVGSTEKAEKVVTELEKLKMWEMLKQ